MPYSKVTEFTPWDSPETMLALEERLAEVAGLFAVVADATRGQGERGARAHAVGDVLAALVLALRTDGAEGEAGLRALRSTARGVLAAADARRAPLLDGPGGGAPVLERSAQVLRPRPEVLEEITRIIGDTIPVLAEQHAGLPDDAATDAVATGLAESVVSLAWARGSSLAATLLESGMRDPTVDQGAGAHADTVRAVKVALVGPLRAARRGDELLLDHGLALGVVRAALVALGLTSDRAKEILRFAPQRKKRARAAHRRMAKTRPH